LAGVIPAGIGGTRFAIFARCRAPSGRFCTFRIHTSTSVSGFFGCFSGFSVAAWRSLSGRMRHNPTQHAHQGYDHVTFCPTACPGTDRDLLPVILVVGSTGIDITKRAARHYNTSRARTWNSRCVPWMRAGYARRRRFRSLRVSLMVCVLIGGVPRALPAVYG